MAYGRVNVGGKQIKYNTKKIVHDQSIKEYTLYQAENPTYSFSIKLKREYQGTDKMNTTNNNDDNFLILLNGTEIRNEKLSSRDGLQFYIFAINAISDTEFLINISYEDDTYSSTQGRPNVVLSQIVTTSKKTNIIDSIKFKTTFNTRYNFNFNYYTIES